MKKSIFLITMGLFFGLVTLSSCGGGEDEAAKKAKADSIAAANAKAKADSIAKAHDDSLAAVMQARLDSARIDSAMRAGMVKGSASKPAAKPTIQVINKPATGTVTATPNTGTGGKLVVDPKTPTTGGGGKLNVKGK